MKKYSRHPGVIALFAGIIILFTGAQKSFAVESYIFDPSHSFVTYHISHFGFSNPSGKWPVNGKLILDPAKPENSKVMATIQIADIDSGVAALNDHLRGKLFFDAAHFPTATFVSNKVTPTGADSAKVEGVLTLHGVSKAVTLDVKINKTGFNPITEKKTVGFAAHTQILRSDYGIVTLLPEIGDPVIIDIDAEAGLEEADTAIKS
jgi:polyisoprenoid-binding protein YceI